MMKQQLSKYILSTVLLPLLLCCSKKNNSVPQGLASLSLINSVVGSNLLIPNFSGSYTLPGSYLSGNFITYGYYYGYASGATTGNQMTLQSGLQRLALYQYPDTLPASKPLLNFAFTLTAASINSLFLTGTVTSPDTLLTVDHPPYHSVTDSSAGFRFVNLSPGSSPISVNIQGEPDGSKVTSLPYKGITGFTSLPATSGISSYTFEFRDAATGTLLASYLADGIDNNGSDPNNPANNWRFRNFTLALLGLPDGAGAEAQTVLLINNY